jgi:hypothetical protein
MQTAIQKTRFVQIICASGDTVVKQSNCTFEIKKAGGRSVVKPRNGSQLVGNVYFYLQYAANIGTANTLDVCFHTATYASIRSVNVFYDGDRRYSKDIIKNQTFKLLLNETSSSMAVDKEGICVALGIKFPEKDSELEFHSVSIGF